MSGNGLEFTRRGVKVAHFLVWRWWKLADSESDSEPATATEPEVQVGVVGGIVAGNAVQWYVDRDEVKRVVCDRIDEEDWLNARRLIEAVEVMEEKHKIITDSIRR